MHWKHIQQLHLQASREHETHTCVQRSKFDSSPRDFCVRWDCPLWKWMTCPDDSDPNLQEYDQWNHGIFQLSCLPPSIVRANAFGQHNRPNIIALASMVYLVAGGGGGPTGSCWRPLVLCCVIVSCFVLLVAVLVSSLLSPFSGWSSLINGTMTSSAAHTISCTKSSLISKHNFNATATSKCCNSSRYRRPNAKTRW